MRKTRANTFVCGSLGELSGQLLRAPADHRAQHLLRAEKLHDEMIADPDGAYPVAYVLFRITGLKAMYATDEKLFARGITHDLREIIDLLSKGLDQVADPAEGCLDTQGLAQQKKVATRTIARWREDGLRWRWGRLKAGGYLQVLFPAAAIAAYEATHADKVAYAASFTQLSSGELRRLFRRARRLAEATGAEPFTIARHLARRTGRSTEALRLILVNHDLKEKPEDRIFRDYSAPLTEEQRGDLFRAWQARVPTRELVRRFKRTRPTIYRVVTDQRIAQVRKSARTWHDLPTLARPDAGSVFLAAPLAEFLPGKADEGPADLPAEIRPFFTSLPPTEDGASRLFMRLNYLHWRVGKLGEALAGKQQPRVGEVEELEHAEREAQTCRAALVRAVLPMVHSLANRHLGQMQGPLRQAALLRLIAVSLPLLDEAVAAFDPGGHIPFPRYLSNTFLRHYAQLKLDPGAKTLPADDLAKQVRSRLEALAPDPGGANPAKPL